jgi:3-oxoacyl-[acyl-carrier protein] reductase
VLISENTNIPPAPFANIHTKDLQSTLALHDAHVLITGATGGIGQAIARLLHAHGAYVHLSGRRTSALADLGKDLSDRYALWPMDLGDPLSIAELINQMKMNKVPLNMLINNGGMALDNLALRIKDDDWANVLQTNLTSCFQLSKGLFPLLSKAPQKYARIINMASIVGFSGNKGQANYAASKAGLIGLTKTLALEWASRHITVNAIAPGYIETPMTAGLSGQALLEKIPCGRMGTPEEIAFAALFLADSRAGYITGQTIHVNGGMGMF